MHPQSDATLPAPESGRTLRGRFRLNALSYGYSQGVTLLVQLVLVPFFLTNWGTERYAEWLVITGIPQILSLMDFGVTQASATRATIHAGSHNREAALRSSQTALMFACGIALFIAATSISVIPWIDLRQVFDLHAIQQDEATITLLCMLGYLCISLITESVGGCFKVVDKTATGVFLLANRRVVDVSLSILLLTCGAGPSTLAMALVVGQVCVLSFIIWVLLRITNWEIMGFSHASLHELSSIWKPAIASMSIPIAQTITLQGGIQALNHFSSGRTVVVFAMARTLMRLIIQLGITTSNSLVPEISRMAGRGEFHLAKKFAFRAGALVCSVSFVAYLAFVLLGQDIVRVWSHGQVTVDKTTLALIGLHAVLNSAWFVPAAVLVSTNRHGRIGATYATSSVVSLLAWILGASIVSPIVGASLLMAIPEVAVVLVLARHLKSRSTETAK